MAHRVTRALAAIGLVGAQLADCLVLTGWTPWGPLAEPNAYFPYDGEAERTKEWAIHCHASQVLLTDYTQYCSHLGRAYAALVREWAEGHSLSGAPTGRKIDSSASSSFRSRLTTRGSARGFRPTRFRSPWGF